MELRCVIEHVKICYLHYYFGIYEHGDYEQFQASQAVCKLTTLSCQPLWRFGRRWVASMDDMHTLTHLLTVACPLLALPLITC
jgi:hypothetical protein